MQRCCVEYHKESFEPFILNENTYFDLTSNFDATAFTVMLPYSLVMGAPYKNEVLNISTIQFAALYCFVLKRKVLYHCYTIVIPSVLIAILTVVIFLLNPESGEKIGLGVTILLVFQVSLYTIGEQMPQSGDTVPILAIYLTMVMTLTSLSVLLLTIIINVNKMGGKQIPNWIRLLFLEKLSQLLRVQVKPPNLVILKNGTVVENPNRGHPNCAQKKKSQNTEHNDENSLVRNLLALRGSRQQSEADNARLTEGWRNVAEVLDWLFFWIYAIITSLLTLTLLVIVPFFMQKQPNPEPDEMTTFQTPFHRLNSKVYP